MNSYNTKLSTRLCTILVILSMLTLQLNAAVKFWDLNGTTPGASTTPTGTWNTSTANWTTDATGSSATTAFAAGDSAIFSAGSDATGNYTVTVSGSPNPTAITNKNGKVLLAGSQVNMVPAAGAATVTVQTGATFSVGSSTAFAIATNVGATIVLDGGTWDNRLTGNAGNFFGTSANSTFLITVTTNNGILRFDTDPVLWGTNLLVILQTGNGTSPGMIISGPGGVTKTGRGVIAVATACTYQGPTIINDGEVRIRTTSNRLPTATDTTVNSPGILNLNGVGQQIGSLAGNGSVGLGAAVLVIGGTNSTIFSGAISNIANAGAGAVTTSSGNGVTKQGTGVLTLSGPNAYNGVLTLSAGGINVTPTGALCDPVADVIVNGGTLSLTNTAQGVENFGGTGGTVILNAGHTLTINAVNGNASRPTTFSGAIVGPGSIVKNGGLTESLLGANTYTGSTTINDGKLITSTASTGGGDYITSEGTTLGVKSTGAGNSLAMSSLGFGNGAMEFDFAGFAPTVAIANVTTLGINGSVSVHAKGFNTTGGPFTLIQYVGTRTGVGAFVPGALPPHTSGTFLDDIANSKVMLTITNADTLVWVSDASGVWDVNNGGNQIWKLNPANTASEYQENAMQGDTVRFDDTKTGTATVSVPGTVLPYKVTVDNSATNYSFSGGGKISGITSLTKSGTGLLLIETTNDYSGGTTLNAGTIATTNNSPLGTGKLTINGGAIRADTSARTISTPVDLSGNVTLGDAVNNGDLTFATGAWNITGSSRQINVDTINATISGVISGNGIIKNGGGTLSLTAANTFSGGVALNSGTLRVNNNASVPANSAVTLADGVTIATTAGTARTVTGAFTANGNFTIGQAAGGTAALTLAGGVNLGGATRTITTPNATDTISGVVTNGGLTKAGSGTLILTSPANTYSGDTTINAGTISVDADATVGGGTLIFNGGDLNVTADRAANVLSNAISIQSNAEVTTTSAATSVNCRFTSSSITAAAGRTLTLRNDGADGAADTFDVIFSGGGLSYGEAIVIDNGAVGKTRLNLFNTNTDPAQTFSGVISGSGAVNRSASVAGTGGTTTFTAANTYSGGTTVNRGLLQVNNTTGSGTGSGAVTVASGGALGGTGSISGAVTVNAGASIGAGASAGILTLTGGLNLSAGGTNIWELAANSTSGAGVNFDQISMTGGNLALGGTSKLQLKFIGSATFPDATNAFWQTSHSWLVIAGSGAAANAGATTFSAVTGAEGGAGTFSTSADANGNVTLNFTPGVQAPAPTIDSAVLGVGTGNTLLSWSSVAGATYGVQYKTNLNQVGWLNLTNLTATGTSTTITDTTVPVPKERYYRVISPFPQAP